MESNFPHIEELLKQAQEIIQTDEEKKAFPKEFQSLKDQLAEFKKNLREKLNGFKNLEETVVTGYPLANNFLDFLEQNNFEKLIKLVKDEQGNLVELVGETQINLLHDEIKLMKELFETFEKLKLVSEKDYEAKETQKEIQKNLKQGKKSLEDKIRLIILAWIEKNGINANQKNFIKLNEKIEELKEEITGIENNPTYIKGQTLEQEKEKEKEEAFLKEIKGAIQSLSARNNNAFEEIFKLIKEDLGFENIETFKLALSKQQEQDKTEKIQQYKKTYGDKKKKLPEQKKDLFKITRELLLRAIQNIEKVQNNENKIKNPEKILPFLSWKYLNEKVFLMGKAYEGTSAVKSFLQRNADKDLTEENKALLTNYEEISKAIKILGKIFGPKYINPNRRDLERKIITENNITPIWKILGEIKVAQQTEIIQYKQKR